MQVDHALVMQFIRVIKVIQILQIKVMHFMTFVQFILFASQKGVTQEILFTRWVALMIQLEKQQYGEFVCGGVVGWLTPTTYIQLAGAGSKIT